MIRFASIAAATASLMLLASAPAVAQNGPYYSATLATKAKKSSLITRNIAWKCADTVCTAGKATDRDAIVCELVVLRAGELTAFSANGTTFDDEALKRCNARAR